MKAAILGDVAALWLPTGRAGIINLIAAADFAHLYEMDVNPDVQDLDSNSTNNFFSSTSGFLTIAQNFHVGLAASHQSAATPEIPFRTNFNGCLTRNLLSSASSPKTLETRVRKDRSTTQGADRWFSAAMHLPVTQEKPSFRALGGG
ncbi:MAG: hypothetical protein GY880_16715 [Planctomycetaceae bacterium]|nr:hypothetical protein [Planctomycetaceae bacterium]